jgi:hypothetical protein
VDVAKLTLDQFLACEEPEPDQKASLSIYDLAKLLDDPPWEDGSEQMISGEVDYATAPARLVGPTFSPENQVLLAKNANGHWVLAGYYLGEALCVLQKYRNLGLSTDLILRASRHRPIPKQRKVTSAGYRALCRAHRIAIERDHAKGET